MINAYKFVLIFTVHVERGFRRRFELLQMHYWVYQKTKHQIRPPCWTKIPLRLWTTFLLHSLCECSKGMSHLNFYD